MNQSETLSATVVPLNVVVGKIIFIPELDRMLADIAPGTIHIERISVEDLPVGTSFIVDIISMSAEEYAKNPYTIHSIREMSPIIIPEYPKVKKLVCVVYGIMSTNMYGAASFPPPQRKKKKDKRRVFI